MSLPDIQLIDHGATHQLTGEQLTQAALPVPADVARFEGQLAVPLAKLFADVPAEKKLCCRSSRGETYLIEAAKLGGFSLLSTNVPSWKLVPAGEDQMHEITVPRFLLRDVQAIEIGSEIQSEDLSDQVFTNLTDALLQPGSVRFLNLTSAGLEAFPKGILDLVRLESLNLGKNSIRELPPEIGTLRNLQILKLSRNKLRTLPEEIGRLKELRELHLSRNEIQSLPEKFWNLKQLQLVNLGNNKLRSIPAEIAQLTALQELELESNPIPKSERSRIQQLIPHVSIEW